jgi:tetratricopeptide (TPR) repeat protein
MKDFDTLWNYSDPAATEIKFREVLASYQPVADLSIYLQLQTQIARTYSLRAMFQEAHALLDTVLPLLPATPGASHVRYHLERGRTFNSSGNKADAGKHFEQAYQVSTYLKEDFYAVDALHMLAIIAPPDQAIIWNEEAIRYAEAAGQERAKNWLGSLYNNLAWSYFDKQAYEKALDIFMRALQWRQNKKSAPEIFMAKWSVARTLRALGRIEEALVMQQALLHEMTLAGKPDGYVYEELGELCLITGNPACPSYFQSAYNELSKDHWFAANEAVRLQRLKELAGNK